jgi:hypothetical protein
MKTLRMGAREAAETRILHTRSSGSGSAASLLRRLGCVGPRQEESWQKWSARGRGNTHFTVEVKAEMERAGPSTRIYTHSASPQIADTYCDMVGSSRCIADHTLAYRLRVQDMARS